MTTISHLPGGQSLLTNLGSVCITVTLFHTAATEFREAPCSHAIRKGPKPLSNGPHTISPQTYFQSVLLSIFLLIIIILEKVSLYRP